jgi:nitrate/nitrite transport system ATP-binding protein
MTQQPYLKFEQIGMSFRRGAMESEVLRDVNLRIAQGEFVSLIGHSGCGKSTLLNILGGLLKSTKGEVFLEGTVVDEPGPDRAIVFQNHSLLPWLTVYGNVAIAVDKVFGGTKSKAERHDWVMHNLELVQMCSAGPGGYGDAGVDFARRPGTNAHTRFRAA